MDMVLARELINSAGRGSILYPQSSLLKRTMSPKAAEDSDAPILYP